MKTIKDKIRLSFMRRRSRTSQADKRKSGKLKILKGGYWRLETVATTDVKGRKAGYLNKKADLMEKMVRKVQIRASQRAWL